MASFLRIGVTGGIGSGKSLVCSFFAELGIPVLSADEIAKDLMLARGVRQDISKLLGAAAYHPNGHLNRQYVASRIFSDVSLQRAVNKLVHPKVEAELEVAFRRLRRSGKKMAIVEAALIYEAGYESSLDAVIVVDAPATRRIERVSRRDGSSAADIRRRMRSQWPVKTKLKKADYVIQNSGSVSDLRKSVEFLASVLNSMVKK